MKKLTLAFVFSTSALSMSAFAEPEIIYTPNSTPKTTTQKLLDQQRSGQYASEHEQHLSGKVSTEVYNRYVKSFSHTIPERFSKDTFKAE